jgi:hypothetical protein
MRFVNLITSTILICTSLLTIIAGDTMAEDEVPFENDTRETATVLGTGYREDSISMMDYYDYYLIRADSIDNFQLMVLKVTFIDVPGSGFIEMRTYLGESEGERDYAYLDRENLSKSIAFDSRRIPSDFYIEISGYGNYSIELKGEKGEGEACFICDLLGMALVAPLGLSTFVLVVVKKSKKSS